MAPKGPAKETVNAWLQWKSSTYPNDDAVVTYNEKLQRKALTFLQAYQMASKFAFLLKENGVQKGDNVVIALPNCLEQIVASLGIMMAGGVNVPVEVFLSTGESFFEVLEKTNTKLLIVPKDEITPSDSYNLVKEFINQPDASEILVFEKVIPNSKTLNVNKICVVSRDAEGRGLLEWLHRVEGSYQCKDVEPGDLCYAGSTSSATSMVRLVAHTHRSVVAIGTTSAKGFLNGEKSILNDNAPTWMTSAPADFLVWPMKRVCLDHWSDFNRDMNSIIADVIEKEAVELAILIPPHAESVAEKWKPRPFPVFNHLWTGGMPITEEMMKRLMPASRRISIRFTSSEVPTFSYNTMTSVSEFKDFDNGLLDYGCQVRAVDKDFKDMAPNKQGKILMKTPCAFHSYIGEAPEETKSRFTPDGWFISYDGGYIRTSDGHLMIMGRNDEMISHNVWLLHPSWLEKDFLQHPEVDKVIVVPIPDEVNFHNICACIVRKAGSRITAQDMKDHFRECYVEIEKDSFVPSHILFFDALPEIAPGRSDRQRSIDIAVRIVTEAKMKGVSTDDQDTFVLSDQ